MAIGLAQSATYNLNIRQDQSAKRAVREIGLVDLMEWTYADQRVYQDDAVMDDRRYLRGGSSMAGLLRINELGTHVDGGGASLSDPHPDAKAIHEVVCNLAALSDTAALAAGLVVEYARSRTRPEKLDLVGQWVEPRKDGQGRVMMSYWDWKSATRLPKRSESKMVGADGSSCRKGQACELKYCQEAEIELHLAECFDLWAITLELIHSDLPPLSAWIVKPFQRPSLIRRTVAARELQNVR